MNRVGHRVAIADSPRRTSYSFSAAFAPRPVIVTRKSEARWYVWGTATAPGDGL
ncbi:hypothetical protein V5P93_002655 [Actinokineospora auranticolor]|uniref:hypothetical protein n=1 Tax=Actinokineospora auranticolor TaxID=155976 RepID=UPI0035A83C50